MSRSFAVLLTLIPVTILSCGAPKEESSLKDVDDIVSMVARGDGNFDVVCRDGSREVVSSQDILANRVCVGGGRSGNVVCVARDNDDRDPWVMATFTRSGRLEKFSEFVFDRKSHCEDAVDDGVDFGFESTVVCVARDNDNRAPWIRVSLDLANGTAIRNRLEFDTRGACVSSLTSGRRLAGGIISCEARDGDNRDPWIFVGLCATGEARINGPSFDARSQCETPLAQGRELRDALLVCIPRDNDNRAPWIIGSLGLNGDYVANLDTTFSSRSSCQDTLNRGVF